MTAFQILVLRALWIIMVRIRADQGRIDTWRKDCRLQGADPEKWEQLPPGDEHR